jgi:hypothetical protein
MMLNLQDVDPFFNIVDLGLFPDLSYDTSCGPITRLNTTCPADGGGTRESKSSIVDVVG